MLILLAEPFFGGSHRQWAEGYRRHSRHQVALLTLPGRHWKWRMFGGAVSLARRLEDLPFRPDVLLASDMLDLGAFLALGRRRLAGCPSVLYFHENQITYPWSPADEDPRRGRNHQYGFINYTSALAADRVCFNSAFHQHSFLGGLPTFLRQFPDHREVDQVAVIAGKSQVLRLGLDLASLQVAHPPSKPAEAVLLWNHRWEYDKAPEVFFRVLFRLKAEGIHFRLIVLGASYRQAPPVFEEARQQLQAEILHWGYAESRQDYARLLWTADILPVTSRQEFFGASVAEAIYCDCYPLLPDRLSYPEHIPPDRHLMHLYQNESDFYDRLKQLIADIEQVRAGSYQHFAAPVDWRILAQHYDDFFEKMLR